MLRVEIGNLPTLPLTTSWTVQSIHERCLMKPKLEFDFVNLESLELLGQIELIHELAILECNQVGEAMWKKLEPIVFSTDDFEDKSHLGSLSEGELD